MDIAQRLALAASTLDEMHAAHDAYTAQLVATAREQDQTGKGPGVGGNQNGVRDESGK